MYFIQVSLIFAPKVLIDTKLKLLQLMAWWKVRYKALP